MNCRTCEYPLWNLTARQCPECGAPFRPSDFEFTINSVQFCCPHCRQPYYGTGEKGHLFPSTFECVTCGRRIDMDEMVLLPTEGVQEEQTRVDTMPWLERKGLFVFKAWWQTIVRSMTSPMRLIRATPMDSSGASAVWFAFTVNAAAMILGIGALLAFFAVTGALAGGRGGGGAMMVATMAAGMGMAVVGGLVAYVVLILLWSLCTHALLRMGGRPAGTLRRTIQALGYSAGPMIVGAVPCIGMYISFVGSIWWLVSATLMLKEAQKVSGGRAAFATLTPPLTIAALAVGGYMILIYFFVSAGPALASQAAAQAQSAQTTAAVAAERSAEAQLVSDALLRYATEGTGQGPPHAGELVRLNFLAPSLLCAKGTASRETTARIGGLSLREFADADEARQREVIQDAAGALPANTAYRVGDYVFTYAGMNLAQAGELWVFILWPDPAANATPPQQVLVGTASGSVVSHPAAVFKAVLEVQNRLRAAKGLPPIPDPASVLHGAPPDPAAGAPAGGG